MKTKIILIILLLNFHLLSYGEISITRLTSHYDIEYELKPDCLEPFHAHLTNAWRVNNLEYGEYYTMTFQDPDENGKFDEIVTFANNPSSWDVEDDPDPYSQQWQWLGAPGGSETFYVVAYIENYSDVELNMTDDMAFSVVYDYRGSPKYAHGAHITTKIKSSMNVSGLDLDCSNPVQYSLNNFYLAEGASASWVIKQNGSTKASGSDTVASASNLSDGAAYAQFTVSFGCYLESLTFTKNFWFGKPGVRPTWPAGNPTPIQAGIDDYVYIYRDGQSDPKGETGYYWTASGSITRLTPQTASVLCVEATSSGTGNFYLYGTNACGTATTGWHGVVSVSAGKSGGGIKVSPIPADSYIEITFDEDKLAKSGLLKEDKTYDFGSNPFFRIVDKLGKVKLTQKYNGEKLTTINVSKLPPGLYTLQLVMEDRVFSLNIMINR